MPRGASKLFIVLVPFRNDGVMLATISPERRHLGYFCVKKASFRRLVRQKGVIYETFSSTRRHLGDFFVKKVIFMRLFRQKGVFGATFSSKRRRLGDLLGLNV